MFQVSDQERNQNAAASEEVDGLKGLIAKLRWAGMDHDADKLCQELGSLAPTACVAQGATETD